MSEIRDGEVGGEPFWSGLKWIFKSAFAMVFFIRVGLGSSTQKVKNARNWGLRRIIYRIGCFSWGFYGGGVSGLNDHN